MAVTIVVEDGAGIETANSYIEVAEARTYAENRGIALASDENELAAQVVLAADYLNSFGDRYKGVQVHRGYPMAWPRFGAYLETIEDGVFPDDQIPAELKRAQCEATIAVHNGLILMPTVQGGQLPIKRRRTGPLEREFFGPGEMGGYSFKTTSVPAVAALIRPLLAVGFGLMTARA